MTRESFEKFHRMRAQPVKKQYQPGRMTFQAFAVHLNCEFETIRKRSIKLSQEEKWWKWRYKLDLSLSSWRSELCKWSHIISMDHADNLTTDGGDGKKRIITAFWQSKNWKKNLASGFLTFGYFSQSSCFTFTPMIPVLKSEDRNASETPSVNISKRPTKKYESY